MLGKSLSIIRCVHATNASMHNIAREMQRNRHELSRLRGSVSMKRTALENQSIVITDNIIFDMENGVSYASCPNASKCIV